MARAHVHLSSVSQRRFIPLKHLLPLTEINLWKRVSLPPPVKEVDGGSYELQVTPLFFSYVPWAAPPNRLPVFHYGKHLRPSRL
jgi:hypothetical protein